MKTGVALGEVCLVIFLLYKGFTTPANHVTYSYLYFGLAILMVILIIGTLTGLSTKK